MKIFMFGAATAASLTLLSPAGAFAHRAAQYNPALGPHDPAQNLPPERRVPDWSIDRRVAWTEQQLQQAERSGAFRPARLQRARAQLGAIRREEARLKTWHGLFTRSDQQYLFHRLDQVNARLGLAAPPWAA